MEKAKKGEKLGLTISKRLKHEWYAEAEALSGHFLFCFVLLFAFCLLFSPWPLVSCLVTLRCMDLVSVFAQDKV